MEYPSLSRKNRGNLLHQVKHHDGPNKEIKKSRLYMPSVNGVDILSMVITITFILYRYITIYTLQSSIDVSTHYIDIQPVLGGLPPKVNN